MRQLHLSIHSHRPEHLHLRETEWITKECVCVEAFVLASSYSLWFDPNAIKAHPQQSVNRLCQSLWLSIHYRCMRFIVCLFVQILSTARLIYRQGQDIDLYLTCLIISSDHQKIPYGFNPSCEKHADLVRLNRGWRTWVTLSLPLKFPCCQPELMISVISMSKWVDGAFRDPPPSCWEHPDTQIFLCVLTEHLLW